MLDPSRLFPSCRVTALPNGLTVVFAPIEAPAVGVTLAVRCGPAFERPRDAGIAHFLEHMLFRGIPTAPTSTLLARQLDAIGADANAATSSDLTMLWHKLLPEHLAEGLALLYAMVTEPELTDLETERQIVLEELGEELDERGRLIAIDQLAAAVLFGKHPYARPILGTAAALQRFTAADLRRQLRTCYRPGNAVLIVSGRFDRRTAERAVKASFGRWQEPDDLPLPVVPATVPEYTGPQVHRVFTGGRSQVLVRLSCRGHACTSRAHEHEKALWRLLDSGPSSPLRRVLQEEQGFCYTLGTDLDVYEQGSALHIDLTLHPDRLQAGIGALLDMLGQRVRHGIPRDECDWMAQQYAKEKRFAAQDLWDYPTIVGLRALGKHPRQFSDDFADVLDLTPAALTRTARRLLRPDNLLLTIVGPVPARQVEPLRKLLADFPGR